MCSISGILSLTKDTIPQLNSRLDVMNRLQCHRGPDGSGIWRHQNGYVGFAHRRLAIIDLDTGEKSKCVLKY